MIDKQDTQRILGSEAPVPAAQPTDPITIIGSRQPLVVTPYLLNEFASIWPVDSPLGAVARDLLQANHQLAMWQQVWEGVRLHVPKLREDNKPLSVAAAYELLKMRADRMEAIVRQVARENGPIENCPCHRCQAAVLVHEINAERGVEPDHGSKL